MHAERSGNFAFEKREANQSVYGIVQVKFVFDSSSEQAFWDSLIVKESHKIHEVSGFLVFSPYRVEGQHPRFSDGLQCA